MKGVREMPLTVRGRLALMVSMKRTGAAQKNALEIDSEHNEPRQETKLRTPGLKEATMKSRDEVGAEWADLNGLVLARLPRKRRWN